MPQTPPPYVDITGISRTVMKDNAQETLVNYNGNARPGEIVADLTVDPPALYIGNNLGQLTSISGGGASGVTQIVAGTGVNITPSGGTGTVTINSSPANIIVNGTSNVSIPAANGNITFGVGGVSAGQISASAVSLGASAGANTQSIRAVAIGLEAGQTVQGTSSVAVGRRAGRTNQGNTAIAIGSNSGVTTQGDEAIAIGGAAGLTAQGAQAVAIGSAAGSVNQGAGAVAVGLLAGTGGQGVNAVAIGAIAGGGNAQAANSIVINATGLTLNNDTANSFVVKPVRIVAGAGGGNPPLGFFSMVYNPTTGEIAYWNGT